MHHVLGDIDDVCCSVNSLNDILSFDEEDFVIQAYLLLLNRPPDAGGKRYYLSKLRAGYSKTHLLAQIARSTERGKQNITLPGLSAKLRWYRIASFFGLPWIFRLFGYSEGNSRSERRDRALLSALLGIRAQVEQLNAEMRVVRVRNTAHPDPGEVPRPADILSKSEDVPHKTIMRQATQTLNVGDQEFALPLSMNSRTRQLVAALEREILFAQKAI